MTQFQLFKTIEEAKEFKKRKGGGVIYGKTSRDRDERFYHQVACDTVNKSSEEYPFSVQWNV